MATVKYSVSAYTADGTTTDYLITWDYLDDDHITVEVDGVSNDDPTANHTFVKLNDTTVRVTDGIGGAIAAGSQIQIRRNTPITTRPISFADGSALLASDLNKNSDYLLYAMQEALDEVDFTVQYQEEAEGFKDATEALRDETQVLRDATQVDTNAADAHRIAAALSETNAATSATNAATSETNAATSETNAATSETNAASSATAALASEGAAATSATNAATSETNAAASAAAAAGSEAGVAADAATATAEAAAAATSEANALIYKNNASTSATNAATSESNSASSASAAALSATNAAGSATAAGISEGNAQTYATNSQASAAAASTAELNAEASEVSAATSATNAAASETSVADNATAAATSEANALTYASNASTSASQAAASAQSIAGYDLGNIAATIADTAVDIFVYDTRKDSDGGAWRKRTQHTSWYNETLNTATRGSRKEFPAVAVIVAEATDVGYVTIYDGDDPDLPMWMVLSTDTQFVGANTKSVSALNGIISVGLKDDRSLNNYNTYETRNRLDLFHFISDKIEGSDGDNSGSYFGTVDGISNRGTLGTNLNQSAVYVLVNSQVNDVAMTVLPNAPIDAATGLPVPTIAVATDGGVSVIKDDGTVVDLTRNTMQCVCFEGTKLNINSSSVGGHWVYDSIPNADEALSPTDGHFEFWDPQYSNLATPAYLGWSVPKIAANYIGTNSANGSVSGLTAFDFNNTDYTKSSTAWITSDYNTGWMNGDIKLATLSDTDDTNVTGSELVDQAASGWYLPTGWAHDGSGTLSYDGTGNIYSKAYDAFTLSEGETYTATINVTTWGPMSVWVHTTTSAPPSNLASFRIDPTSTGVKTWTFTATTSGTYYITLQNNNAASPITVSDISVRLAEEDRSVNGNGLQVFGTVTKSAVATGADLVGYSGFSSSNYLRQPYNSDLDFGTSDFCIMGWAVFGGAGSYNHILSYGDYGTTANSGFVLRSSSDNTKVEFRSDAANAGSQIYTGVPTSGWVNVVVVRSSGTLVFYINGNLVKTVSGYTGDVGSGNTATLMVGYGGNESSAATSQNPWGGSLALLRASATAPSPEQIKKIYEDEKRLFQEGAQATLYGTSDAVTALAYDDSTELLHVGTSEGRSVFQGLRRVDNTTTAVGAAISASNSMVAED